LKTIKINLSGELKKNINTSNSIKLQANPDTKNEFIAYIAMVCIMVVFFASVGGWLLTKQFTKNLDEKLVKLNHKLNSLREEETALAAYGNDLKKEKQAVEYKILVQNQLDDAYFCWSSVLKEIAEKIPREIIVQKIDKTGGGKKSKTNSDSFKMKISGIVPPNKKIEPIMAVSLFIYNLNENKNSLLTGARISKFGFNDKTGVYEFEVETSINTKKADEKLNEKIQETSK